MDRQEGFEEWQGRNGGMERLVWKKQTGSGGVRVSGQKKKVEMAITIFFGGR